MSITHRMASGHVARNRNPPPAVRRNMVFVFGSNTAGIHGAGAARAALLQHGAKWGEGEGHVGNSYAIPTKEGLKNGGIRGTLPILTIAHHVDAFIRYAREHPELKFQVTRIGCGLAGLKDEHIAPMFLKSPENCYFDRMWINFLPARAGEPYKFWGTFDG